MVTTPHMPAYFLVRSPDHPTCSAHARFSGGLSVHVLVRVLVRVHIQAKPSASLSSSATPPSPARRTARAATTTSSKSAQNLQSILKATSCSCR